MKNNTIICLIVTLVVGFGVGYAVGNGKISSNSNESLDNTHKMPDGSMMENDNSMSGMMHSMNASLMGKTGDDFDKTFIEEMIVHHQGAVDMAELALTNAKHQEIKNLANAIIVAQNKEINDMKVWHQNWFKVR